MASVADRHRGGPGFFNGNGAFAPDGAAFQSLAYRRFTDLNGNQNTLQSATGRISWLSAICGGAWLLCVGPAYALAGAVGLEGVTYAALLCLVPGCAVMAIGTWVLAMNSLPPLIMGGTVLRLLFVLAAVLVLRTERPDLAMLEFHIWLVTFYIVTLAAETWLLTKPVPDLHSD